MSASTISMATQRAQQWKRMEKVIAEVREMPVFDAGADTQLELVGEAYNELRMHAVNLARWMEESIERQRKAVKRKRQEWQEKRTHQRTPMGWKD